MCQRRKGERVVSVQVVKHTPPEMRKAGVTDCLKSAGEEHNETTTNLQSKEVDVLLHKHACIVWYTVGASAP